MIRLFLSRLLGGMFVVLLVATFSHFMLRLAPGGPFDQDKPLPPLIKKNLEKAYGFDKPPLEQYAHHMKQLLPNPSNGFRPYLGYSVIQKRPVVDIVKAGFPVSFKLGFAAIGFACFFGIGLGVLAASRQNSLFDHGAMSLALLGISIPSFVLAPLLILLFGVKLGWLPVARLEGLSGLVLPSLTLGLIYMGVIARLSRSGMLETLSMDYIRTAHAKGLAKWRVVWKHAIRIGLMPVVTYLGPAFATIITGSFVVEKIFQIPGLGFYFVESVSTRDYDLLTGLLVVYALFMVVANFLVDMAYGFLDPRIRDV